MLRDPPDKPGDDRFKNSTFITRNNIHYSKQHFITINKTNKKKPTKMSTVMYKLTASAFSWNISENKTINAWGFNNTVPGPILRASKGDTVIVKVKNELPEPTIIHWHGVRLESSMDGTSSTQRPIQPGEEFEYRFSLPDAGTFWYHSHHNETEQMEKGMYGALIVEEPTDPVFDGEKIFMIDDMKLTTNGAFKTGNTFSRWIERHDGREGETLLINGKEKPLFNIGGGQKERWRFINASSARYFYLSLGGRKFKVIGSDGGLLQKAEETDSVLIVPGERIEIVAGPFNEGETVLIESLPYNRMTFVKTKRRHYATVIAGKKQRSIAEIPATLRTIEPLAPTNTPVNRRIKFSVGASLKHGIDFVVNGGVHTVDEAVEVGKLQVWEIANTSLMDHPFHLHGFFFQILEMNGKAVENIKWKDTINLAPRSKVKIAWVPDNRTGSWMYHCHILEHHEAGMMGHFEVTSSKTPQLSQQSARASHRHHVHLHQ
jgi:FtsP/CotA-like multicopper oxidase with cupredoxin domain